MPLANAEFFFFLLPLKAADDLCFCYIETTSIAGIWKVYHTNANISIPVLRKGSVYL